MKALMSAQVMMHMARPSEAVTTSIASLGRVLHNLMCSKTTMQELDVE